MCIPHNDQLFRNTLCPNLVLFQVERLVERLQGSELWRVPFSVVTERKAWRPCWLAGSVELVKHCLKECSCLSGEWLYSLEEPILSLSGSKRSYSRWESVVSVLATEVSARELLESENSPDFVVQQCVWTRSSRGGLSFRSSGLEDHCCPSVHTGLQDRSPKMEVGSSASTPTMCWGTHFLECPWSFSSITGRATRSSSLF